MNDQTDGQLLRIYAERRVEPAFAELVRRHVDFVYSAAARMVRDSHLAEDVTQGVFVALARNAPQLSNRATLAGWLHQTAQNIAAQTVRTIERRRAREQEATTMNQLLSGETEASWEQIVPHLDAALGELSEPDRDAIVLRYFENKSAAEIGQLLGVSDEAAQKRVSRAVERLREFFANRGVAAGAGCVVALISAHAVQAAPAGLATTISAAVFTGAAVSTSTVVTATKTVAIPTVPKVLVVAALIAAAGVGIFEARQAAQLRRQNQVLQQQQALLAGQIQQLQGERDDAANRLAGLAGETAKSNRDNNELLKLRGEVGVLRRQLDESSGKIAMTHSNTNPPVPQIHVKARFVSIPNEAFTGMGDFTGVLTTENASNVLKTLKMRPDFEILAEPEVVTTSGRQTQIRVTQAITVVTNFTVLETNNTPTVVPQTTVVETGPILDVIPRVLADGYTIELPCIASMTDFLGYAPSTNTTPAYSTSGQEFDVPTVSPQFLVRQETNSVNLFDGQTLVFALNNSQASPPDALLELDGGKSKEQEKKTIVLITANLVDAAGNLVHRDFESYTNIPPQVDGK